MPITLTPPVASLPVPSAGDRSVWSAEQLDPVTFQLMRDRAVSDLATPWHVPLAHGFARYGRDGNRDEYEDVVFAREKRLTRAAVMAAATLDPVWIDEVGDGVVLLCEQSTWCWPAHDDTFQRGAVLPDVTRPCLDLGAGQVAALLAWTDHLLGEQLDERFPGIRARIRYEVDRRVLTPFVTRRDWHWLQDVHNWSAWIHGNVLVAGLVLMPEGDARRELVELTVEGLDRYLASIPADGAIDEGYMYWWQGACRALEALDVLHFATSGALGGIASGGGREGGEREGAGLPDSVRLSQSASGAVREVVAFPHRMHFGGDWYLNFADGAARVPSTSQPWDALHRAARRVGDADAQAHAAAHRRRDAPVADESQGLGRVTRALTDRAWIDAAPSSSPLPRDVWLPSTQVLLARTEAGTTSGLTLAAKGGHNGEHHNHNDVGSVVIALNGVPVIVDPGRPTYTAQTFGPDRYEIWTMQSLWHNVPEICGMAQGVGSGFSARDVRVRIGDDDYSNGDGDGDGDGDGATSLSLDLADAYPSSDILSWHRESLLDRRRRQVRITDSWKLGPGDHLARTRLHLMVAGDLEVGDGYAVIKALDGAGSLRLTWSAVGGSGTVADGDGDGGDGDDVTMTVSVRELDDPWLSDVWGDRLSRLEIDVTELGPVGRIVLVLEEQ